MCRYTQRQRPAPIPGKDVIESEFGSRAPRHGARLVVFLAHALDGVVLGDHAFVISAAVGPLARSRWRLNSTRTRTRAWAQWLDAQEHSGHNIGNTETHVMFVELKEPSNGVAASKPRLGPTA
jgi:hypothetical protein